MRSARPALFCALMLAAGFSLTTPAAGEADAGADARGTAATPGEVARRARVVVRVNDRAVTVGEVEDRLATVAPFQLSTFGATREEILKAFVDQVIVRELLLGAGAEMKGLAKELPTKQLLLRARSTATLRALRNGTAPAGAIPMEDVQKFYDENRASYDAPDRVNVWRILVKDDAEAKELLKRAKAEPTVARWNELSRELSIDKATNLRGGNLGFVGPDGKSSEAGLKVDPAIMRAVASVKDGEMVPEPVAEEGGFGVVWRRGTVPATKRTVAEAAAQIRATLYRQRGEQAEKRLIDDLRKANVKDVNEGLLGMIELGAEDAGLSIPRSVPPAKPSSR